MVSPLASIVAGARQQPTQDIGDLFRQQAITNSNLATQDLQRQSIMQSMAGTQREQQMGDALSQAQYINRLGKQLLSTPESQWPQILQPNLPQLQSIGYSPDMLRNMTRDQVASVVAQTEPLVSQPGAAKPVTLKEGEILVDPTTGKQIAAGGEKTEKTQPMIDKLRTRYDNFNKDLIKTDAAFRKVKSAPKTAAGDMSLIFGYMKLLDPGSTVREGEFATAEAAAGVPTRILNAYNRALSGERLSEDQRAEFVESAEQAFGAQQESADNQVAVLLLQADQDGVPREKVLGAKNLREFEKRAADRLIKQQTSEETSPKSLFSSALNREITEQDIQETLQANPGVTREQLMQQLGVK